MVILVTSLDKSKESRTSQKGIRCLDGSFVQCVPLIFVTLLTDCDLSLLFIVADIFTKPSLTTAPEALTAPSVGMGNRSRAIKG